MMEESTAAKTNGKEMDPKELEYRINRWDLDKLMLVVRYLTGNEGEFGSECQKAYCELFDNTRSEKGKGFIELMTLQMIDKRLHEIMAFVLSSYSAELVTDVHCTREKKVLESPRTDETFNGASTEEVFEMCSIAIHNRDSEECLKKSAAFRKRFTKETMPASYLLIKIMAYVAYKRYYEMAKILFVNAGGYIH